MRGIVVAAVACAAGCYRHVGDAACSIACEPSRSGADCPSDQACIDGICRGSSDTCGGSNAVDAAIPDAPIDAELIDTTGCQTFGTGVYKYDACPPPPIGSAAKLPPTLDTQTECNGGYYHSLAVAGGSVCVVNADLIIVPAEGMRAFGSAPLVLAANSISISGNIDVGSSNIAAGAGANYACNTGSAAGSSGNGGAGGTASGQGGAGGSYLPGGTGIPAPQADTLYAMLRSGCPGAGGDNGSFGGASGGLVYLIATGAIDVQVSSEILAGGAGGRGGGTGGKGGGGGGGAGGAIVLDGGSLVHPSTTLTLCALGGGGGGGGPTSSGASGGSSGQDGCITINTSGGGGQGVGGGGTGGNGDLATRDGDPGNAVGISGAGGGGGGGASGYIVGYAGTNASVLGTNTLSNPAPQ